MTALETTGSGLIAALEQTWADIRRRAPELLEVVVVTGTGLSSGALHIDATWGHFGADHWVKGHPTEQGQGAALDLSAARRRPELFVAGSAWPKAPARLCRPCSMRPSTPSRMSARSRTPPEGASTTTSDDEGREGEDGHGQPPTGKAGERFKVACGCQPPRSFWIRSKQYNRGRSLAACAARSSNPRTGYQHGRKPCWKPLARSGRVGLQALWVRRQRGSGSGPGRPGRRPAQGPARLGGRGACLAGAGPPPAGHRW